MIKPKFREDTRLPELPHPAVVMRRVAAWIKAHPAHFDQRDWVRSTSVEEGLPSYPDGGRLEHYNLDEAIENCGSTYCQGGVAIGLHRDFLHESEFPSGHYDENGLPQVYPERVSGYLFGFSDGLSDLVLGDDGYPHVGWLLQTIVSALPTSEVEQALQEAIAPDRRFNFVIDMLADLAEYAEFMYPHFDRGVHELTTEEFGRLVARKIGV